MRVRLTGIAILLLCAQMVWAQRTVRDQIDRERAEVGSFLNDKALQKSRSFIRRDSTYYVGYLMQGAFLFFRANDELGFRRAIEPLEKSMAYMEKDYDKQLRTRTNNYAIYSANYRYHYDYGLITYFLSRCYQNVEQQELAMQVVRHVQDRNFQMETSLDSYNTMSW